MLPGRAERRIDRRSFPHVAGLPAKMILQRLNLKRKAVTALLVYKGKRITFDE